jgi:hypothetical protein
MRPTAASFTRREEEEEEERGLIKDLTSLKTQNEIYILSRALS